MRLNTALPEACWAAKSCPACRVVHSHLTGTRLPHAPTEQLSSRPPSVCMRHPPSAYLRCTDAIASSSTGTLPTHYTNTHYTKKRLWTVT